MVRKDQTAREQRRQGCRSCLQLHRSWPSLLGWDFSTPVLRSESASAPNVRALPDARSRRGVNGGEELRARPVKPFEGGRGRLRWLRANSWTPSPSIGI